VGPLARRLGADRPDLRAGLVSSQLIGFAVARWVVEVEALTALATDEAVDLLAPTVQRYLVGPL